MKELSEKRLKPVDSSPVPPPPPACDKGRGRGAWKTKSFKRENVQRPSRTGLLPDPSRTPPGPLPDPSRTPPDPFDRRPLEQIVCGQLSRWGRRNEPIGVEIFSTNLFVSRVLSNIALWQHDLPRFDTILYIPTPLCFCAIFNRENALSSCSGVAFSNGMHALIMTCHTFAITHALACAHFA